MSRSLTQDQRGRTTEGAGDAASAEKDLAQQIFDTMIQVHGQQPGHRPVHAKGIVSQGDFVPSKAAASLSRAAHFQGASVPLTVRFSDGGPDPNGA